MNMNEKVLKEFLTEPSNELKNKIEEFIEFHINNGNKIVFITSGGTMVELEKNTVRFVDNFSLGTRGSATAEYFLKSDQKYAVLFLYRSKSLSPFERILRQNSLFDILDFNDTDNLQVKRSFEVANKETLKIYKEVLSDNRLLKVPFQSIYDYLSLFSYICQKLDKLKTKVLIYLAAAVSDFYLPRSDMPTHKIQSRNHNELNLSLKPVPKFLGKLKSEWCKSAFVISFKLETDDKLLISKCKDSLCSYKHDLVIGNLLHDRKSKITFVHQGTFDIKNVSLDNGETDSNKEIEQFIVEYIIELHKNHIKSSHI